MPVNRGNFYKVYIKHNIHNNILTTKQFKGGKTNEET